MTTPNSFDDELDKAFIDSMQPKFGEKPSGAMLGWEEIHWPTLKQSLKSLYLTHRNAELEKLLEQTLVFEDIPEEVAYVPVSAIKDLMKGDSYDETTDGDRRA